MKLDTKVTLQVLGLLMTATILFFGNNLCGNIKSENSKVIYEKKSVTQETVEKYLKEENPHDKYINYKVVKMKEEFYDLETDLIFKNDWVISEYHWTLEPTKSVRCSIKYPRNDVFTANKFRSKGFTEKFISKGKNYIFQINNIDNIKQWAIVMIKEI